MKKFHSVSKQKASKSKSSKPLALPAATFSARIYHHDHTGVAWLGVEFLHSNLGRHFVLVDSDLTENAAKLRMALRKAGAVFSGSKADQIKLLQDMLDRMPAANGVVTAKPGWRDGGFVLGHQMIGDGVAHHKWAPGSSADAALGKTAGSLDDWRRKVATPLAHSTYATFAACLGFGAPLPGYMDMKRLENRDLPKLVAETFTANFSADSGAGKTIGGAVVAGLSGPPRPHDWNFTPTSLEESAAAHNDLVLVLDDTETYLEESPPLKVQIKRVNELIPAGQSKARSKVVNGHSYANLTWTTFGISTSPTPIDELAVEDKWKRSKGHMVRYVDITVPPPAAGGIFDALPDGVSSKDVIQQLETAVQNYYGTALPAFIHYLLQADRSAEIVKLVDRFLNNVGVASAGDGWDIRLAKKFAVAYAGGKLAVRAGVVPWNDDWPYKAVVACYRNTLTSLSKSKKIVEDKILNLRTAASDPIRFPRIGTGAAKAPITCGPQMLGVITLYKGRPVVAVRQEGMKALAGSSEAANQLVERLNGILCGGHGGVRTTQLPVPLKIGSKVEEKPRFYLLDPEKLGVHDLGK